jgi:hypothetical protein
MIQDDLHKGESPEVLNASEPEGVTDRDHIKKADEIEKTVTERDEKGFFLRDLEEEGDGEKKGEDDDARKHQPLDTFQKLLMKVR